MVPENAVEKYRVGFEAGGERGDSRSEVVDFGSEVGTYKFTWNGR